MRFSSLSLVLAASVMLSVPSTAQRPDDQIAPRSVVLMKQGDAALAAGKLETANDSYEAALAADPRNRAAFVALARGAQRQQLFGKAVRLTNKALLIEPADRDALQVQGEAMVQLGALPRAKENLVKLQKLCAKGCPQLASLNAAITRGPTVAVAKTEVPKKPN
jgi:Tfp pilus assembly protein PilF